MSVTVTVTTVTLAWPGAGLQLIEPVGPVASDNEQNVGRFVVENVSTSPSHNGSGQPSDQLRVAIVGAGRIHDAVVARDGAPVVRTVLPLSLTIDHRVVTGVESLRFLRALITRLQGTT
mgnify:CR=1 FL=1